MGAEGDRERDRWKPVGDGEWEQGEEERTTTEDFITRFSPLRDVSNNEETNKGFEKGRGRYVHPRIPMLSRALMWDNSSCRETTL